MKHTEGKLKIYKRNIGLFWSLLDEQETVIATGIDEADAPRLADCWNLCIDIPTEGLTGHNIVSITQFTDLQSRLDHSEKVKGELLGASKRHLKMITSNGCITDYAFMITPDKLEPFEQAIKSAEEGSDNKTLSCTCKDGQFGEANHE